MDYEVAMSGDNGGKTTTIPTHVVFDRANFFRRLPGLVWVALSTWFLLRILNRVGCSFRMQAWALMKRASRSMSHELYVVRDPTSLSKPPRVQGLGWGFGQT